MSKKSLKKNAVLNAIRVAVGILFPLITYPYITRILGVDNLGRVQFGLSLISYFALIAALGVTTYGTRECASVRNNRKKFSKLASEIFTINIISTIISYLALLILLLLPTPLKSYQLLVFIQSITIIFNTLSVDWIYNATEDFLYITIRTILIQIAALILTFTLVKRPDDYYLYALISTITTACTGIVNFLHARKYCDIKLTNKINFKKHIKPLFALFAAAIAVQIYVNSDIIMLGLMSTENSVGLYSVPVKIYTIVKTILSATITITIPRFAYYIAANKTHELKKLSTKIINTSIIFILPATTLLFLLSNNIISIISGTEYLDGNESLKLLSFALLFAIAANFFGNAILVGYKLDKKFLVATIIGATTNIVLNLFFIPIWQQNGAALSTIIAETLVTITCAMYSRGLYGTYKTCLNFLQSISGCLGIIIIYMAIHTLTLNIVIELILTCATGAIVYGATLLIQKNQVAMSIVKTISSNISSLKHRSK